jgi:hypothetical protein
VGRLATPAAIVVSGGNIDAAKHEEIVNAPSVRAST